MHPHATGARRVAPGEVRVPGVEFPGADAPEQRVVRHMDGVLQEAHVGPDRRLAQGTVIKPRK